MRRWQIGTVVAALAVAAAACGGGDGGGDAAGTTPPAGGGETTTPPAPGGASVEVADNVFKPAAITVKAGTTIEWRWTGSQPHTVTATKGADFTSGDATTSGTFSHTVEEAGTIEYFCEVHGKGMSGTIEVTA